MSPLFKRVSLFISAPYSYQTNIWDKVFKNESLWKTAPKKIDGVWSALGRLYPFKFFKGCLPQIFLWSILEYLVSFVGF